MDARLKKALEELAGGQGRLVVLTGAGISAESGIPTFRGPEGYWTVGSREYRPEQMATWSMFCQAPEEVWQWYLYRLGVCRVAQPNAGHQAVVRMERALGDRFVLITQNVDGLHLRAGSSLERTYQIHGAIEFMRCSRNCTSKVMRLPVQVRTKEKNEALTDADRRALKCPECGERARPHVLWFDECYNEEHYRFNSSIEAAVAADVLLTVGTSGATNLPMQVGTIAAQRGAVLADINPAENPFSRMAEASGGHFLKGPSGAILPDIAAVLEA